MHVRIWDTTTIMRNMTPWTHCGEKKKEECYFVSWQKLSNTTEIKGAQGERLEEHSWGVRGRWLVLGKANSTEWMAKCKTAQLTLVKAQHCFIWSKTRIQPGELFMVPTRALACSSMDWLQCSIPRSASHMPFECWRISLVGCQQHFFNESF